MYTLYSKIVVTVLLEYIDILQLHINIIWVDLSPTSPTHHYTTALNDEI